MIVFLLGLAGFVFVILSAVVAYSGQIALFANKEGFETSRLQNVLAVGLFIVWIAISGLLVFTLENVKSDYDAFISKKKEETSPPVVEDGPDTPQQKMQAAYHARGFTLVGRLEDAADAPQLWTGARAADAAGIFRKPGVLIYPDGSATQFSIAVLYGHDAWAIGDWVNVDRSSGGRPVKIATTVKRQLVRELLQTSDYLLSVGLASSAPTRDDERNENLAHARAWNAGVAVLRLKLMQADRIVGISLGYARALPQSPAFESRQRAVLLVGVNAQREVNILDVIEGTSRLTTIDGVDLTNYSTRVKFRALPPDADYRKPDDINTSTGAGEAWILPAVGSSK